MKKIFLIVAVSLPLFASAKEFIDDKDTTIVINGPERVTVIQNNSMLSVEVVGNENNPNSLFKTEMITYEDAFFLSKESVDDWNFKIPFVKNKKDNCISYNKKSINLSSFGLGLVNAVDCAEGLNVDMGSSFEFMFDNIISWEYSPWRNGNMLSMGFGLNWKNWRMTSRNRFIKDNGNIVIGDYPENADIQFSRIKVFSLTVPLTYTQHIYDKIYLSVGPIININTHASIKTRYKENGVKVKETDSNIHQSPITVDLMANLRFKSIGLYFKYSPNNVLDTDYAPKFKSISTGLTLFY